MMCCGKSTVGKLLAARLGRHFVDLDRLIEARVGPILPFVQREGEEAFRALEARVLEEAASTGAAVVATGGGTPMAPTNRARMLEAGAVVWIDVPIQALMPRIERAGGDRPLLFGLRGIALRGKVEELLAERVPNYCLAHHRIDGDCAPEEVVARIIDALSAQRR